MWPFRRKKKDDVPAEIQEYYQAERRERAGVAWLVALLTLLLTVSIVLALFFGGRWVYRRFNNDANKQATTQEATSEQSTEATESAPIESGAVSQDPTPTPGSNETPGVPIPVPAPTPAATPPVASGTQPVPATGSTVQPGQQIPNTGSGNVIAIFLATSLVSAALHRLFFIRRLDR